MATEKPPYRLVMKTRCHPKNILIAAQRVTKKLGWKYTNIEVRPQGHNSVTTDWHRDGIFIQPFFVVWSNGPGTEVRRLCAECLKVKRNFRFGHDCKTKIYRVPNGAFAVLNNDRVKHRTPPDITDREKANRAFVRITRTPHY